MISQCHITELFCFCGPWDELEGSISQRIQSVEREPRIACSSESMVWKHYTINYIPRPVFIFHFETGSH